jgi:peptidoglycan/LPS O-acetylase OafA/YrhL
MLFLHEDDLFPGWYALPCLGTAFRIAAGTNARDRSELSLVGRALSWRPAVWIGDFLFGLSGPLAHRRAVPISHVARAHAG